MKTVNDIVTAASNLDASQFFQLRRKLDRLAKKLWEEELARVTKKMKRANITEAEITRLVMRRRYEGRS